MSTITRKTINRVIPFFFFSTCSLLGWAQVIKPDLMQWSQTQSLLNQSRTKIIRTTKPTSARPLNSKSITAILQQELNKHHLALIHTQTENQQTVASVYLTFASTQHLLKLFSQQHNNIACTHITLEKQSTMNLLLLQLTCHEIFT